MKTFLFLIGFMAGVVVAPRLLAPAARPAEHWSAWSAPVRMPDNTFKSVSYLSQFRTNLDTGLIERKEIE
jgi:hypothetical protein